MKNHVKTEVRDGEPLTVREMKSIEYYREYPHKKKSYPQSLLNETAK